MGNTKTMEEVDPEGNTFGAGGLFLTVSELHKLGMFYLQNGCWNGKKLLSKEWIHESTRKQVENNKNSYGYGYLFWGGRYNSFLANGKYGQYTMIFRDKNTVISLMAESRDTDHLEEIIANEVYTKL